MRRTLFEDAGSAGGGEREPGDPAGEEGPDPASWVQQSRAFIHAAPPLPRASFGSPPPPLPPSPKFPISPSPPRDIPEPAAHPLPNPGTFPIFIKKPEKKKKKFNITPEKREKKIKNKQNKKKKINCQRHASFSERSPVRINPVRKAKERGRTVGKSQSLFSLLQSQSSGAGGCTEAAWPQPGAAGTASRPRTPGSTEIIPCPRCFRGNFGSGGSKLSSAPTWLQHRLVMKHLNLFKLLLLGFFLLF